jgi:hypothetical protein
VRQHIRNLAACALALSAFTTEAAAPAGARPDFNGIWLPDPARAEAWPAQLPLTPQARTFMEKYDPASHDPTSFCMPFGTPRNMLQTQFPVQIIHTPQRLTMVLQPDLSNAEVRRIPLDGSALPDSPDPSWFGTSRGRWDGNTLVIETSGLRDDSLISNLGLPHSDQLRVIERFSLVSDARGKVLVDELELRDAAAYTAPIRTRRYFVLAPQATFTAGNCVDRRWTDKLWRDRLQEHAEAARAKAGAK